MKVFHMLAIGVAVAMLPVCAVAAQSSGFGYRTPPPPPPPHHGGGKHGGFFVPLIVVERPFGYAQDREVPVIVEREVVREVVPPAPPAPPPPPRKPYVVGKSYASLPGGCMKLIEGGASYYYCGGGEWYRLAGKQYLAVRQP